MDNEATNLGFSMEHQIPLLNGVWRPSLVAADAEEVAVESAMVKIKE